MDDGNTDLREIVLEKIEFGLDNIVQPSFLDAEVSVEQYLENLLRVRVKGFLLGESMGHKAVFKYPLDWWQAFKKQWFPRWLLKKFPVMYRTIEFDAKAYYPDFKPSLPPELSNKYKITVFMTEREERMLK